MVKFTFDRIVNVLLLVAVIYGIALMRTSNTPRPQATYQPGEAVSAIAGVPYGEAKRTAVLFVRSTCHFCTESMPFYRELAKDHRVVAISGDSREVLDRYLADNGLMIPHATVPRGDWAKLTGTPTIVVVDDGGHVVKSWVGTLSADRQRDLLATLNYGG